jgi:hypothetical protein
MRRQGGPEEPSVPRAHHDRAAIARELVGEILRIADAQDLRRRVAPETPGRERDRMAGAVTVSKRRAIFTQLVNRAVTADFPATKILLDFLRDIERQNDPASADATEFSAADQMVFEQLKARVAKG